MKCPYQTIITRIPEHARGYSVGLVIDITEFGECLKSECPFYYTEEYITEHCHRAESEVSE